ncbi:NAD(P)/FAD-dependent oxidoreductase [Leptolyngbya sp. NK1-12]|uniref:demethylphylloquinone reductase n=1 Tax=Leptolyngbya sp. NK1-12 TaxID=2547451 RepID=A0AA97AEX4_9CYAN|nr:NAD(P)/FAD-dependent oxidoreductase [Leptolyngbya sp. NK1-12]WNZ22545.1 NAD(P)/FAD-dependent oxidoreductase [Leptolyngbya sp. NK1-12]
MTQHPRICILGGGFGGLYTALKLIQFPWEQSQPEITLVDQRDRFLFSPLLYELLTGELETWEIAPPYTELLANTSIRFCQAEVASIELEAKQVQLKDQPALSYDYLVLAMGGETPLDTVPGVADYAIPFRTIADAYRLEEKLRTLEAGNADKIRVAIVGGGYSGVELACKLADRLGERGRIRIVEATDQILRNSPEFNRTTAAKALSDRKVWIDLETKVQAITADSISLDYRNQVDTIPVEIVLWTVGTQVAKVVQELPLPHNARGQVLVNPMLQVVDHPELFAVGDLAECQDAEGQRVPATAQAAFQQAEYAGWNLWAAITGRPLLPFRYQALGEMMTLGTDNATLAGFGLKLEGPAAHIARRLIYLYRMPTLDHQIKVGLNWIAQPIRELLSS